MKIRTMAWMIFSFIVENLSQNGRQHESFHQKLVLIAHKRIVNCSPVNEQWGFK